MHLLFLVQLLKMYNSTQTGIPHVSALLLYERCTVLDFILDGKSLCTDKMPIA